MGKLKVVKSDAIQSLTARPFARQSSFIDAAAVICRKLSLQVKLIKREFSEAFDAVGLPKLDVSEEVADPLSIKAELTPDIATVRSAIDPVHTAIPLNE